MKKNIFYLIALTMLVLGIGGCKKTDTIPTSPLASLNVTNVINGGNTATLNNSTLTVGSNAYFQFTLNAGNSKVYLCDSTSTPPVVYYNKILQTVNGSYYSLFLTGNSTSAIDNVLIKESYKNYTDSLFGVRFINLSTGSGPISVDIQGQANGSTVQSLAYKAYSNFIQFPAKLADASYSFEFRDAGSGTLLASYTLNTPYFHNVTLAFYGGPGSQSVLQVNDY